MKTALVLGTILLTAFAADAADDAGVTFIGHEAVAKGGRLVSAPNLIVMMNRRTAAGEVEVHDTETDTLYVLDGAATIVTGGTMLGGKVTAPGQQRGTDIKGGQAQKLTKGDVIVIPSGVPHWFKEVPTSIDYYVVKVVKQ